MSARKYLLRRMCIMSGRRTTSTAAALKPQITDILLKPTNYTLETYPPNHKKHLSQIYPVPLPITEVLHNFVRKEWKIQIECFQEFSILIRNPAIEIMSYLEQTNYTKAINKYVLYGKQGTGKSTTAMHLVHYGLSKEFIVLHVPMVHRWFTLPLETANSPLVPGQIDLVTHAGTWLNYFNNLNKTLLSTLDLRTTSDYTWNQRESTKCGEPLSNIIEYGIKRTKFACGVIDVLVNELKAACTAGKCKMLVVIHDFNALTSNYTLVRDDMKQVVLPERISLTTSFLNSVDSNWCNGAAILIVDQKAVKFRRDSELPVYLLDKKGFERIDPFVPISVTNYSSHEFNIMVDHYEKKKWIRNITDNARTELQLLSSMNPLELWRICKSL